ncbi:P-loop containing nucleoside triphosphate hydrolase protein [Lichtheimia hyalospora FSU 10163]|nr:P-loop containing nucleoside triphosphate hydrolase protein [Lichtheimia hyalospora FSU 10163]
MFLFQPSYFRTFFDTAASLLETLTDDTFWISLVGERVFLLVKRYSGNDAILVGIFLSLGPTLLSILQGCYWTIKNTLDSWLYVSVEIVEEETIFNPVQEFVKRRYRTIQEYKNVSGVTTYRTIRRNNRDYDEERSRLGLVPKLGTTSKIIYKGHTLWIHRYAMSSMDRTTSKRSMSRQSREILDALSESNLVLVIKMRSRNLKLLQDIIQEWVDEYYDERDSELIVYKCMGEVWQRHWGELCSKQVRRFESVVLKETQKEELLNDLLVFRTQKEWYIETGIPYRRGYLLYGPPGTGKTSFIQSLASKMHMNVALISLTTPMDDDTFTQMLITAPKNCFIVMEDIDHCIINDGDGSEQHFNSRRVTASGLLNALDGVYSAEGSVLFLTCNDLTRVVPALLRPGRVDFKMELGYADQYQIEEMFWRFFGEPGSKRDQRLMPFVNKLLACLQSGYLTPAELQSFFMIHAMALRAGRNAMVRTGIKLPNGNAKSLEDIDSAMCDTENINTTNTQQHQLKVATLDHLISSIPSFLEKVEYDREQARKHEQAKKEKGKGNE